jgi:hypothetical protein
MMVYDYVAFGSPLHISYASQEGYEGMHTGKGIFGVYLPRLDVLAKLLFGWERGVLLLAPVLAVAPIGWWMLFRRDETRAAGLTAAAITTFYFLVHAGYYYWPGGWSYGPRYSGAALGFAALGVAPIWARANRPVKAMLVVLTLAGVFNSLAAVSTSPQPPNWFDRPMPQFIWPAFFHGDIAINWQGVLDLRGRGEPLGVLAARGVPPAAWNLGTKLGLHGPPSLLPLFAFWLVGAWMWLTSGEGRNRGWSAAGRASATTPASL